VTELVLAVPKAVDEAAVPCRERLRDTFRELYAYGDIARGLRDMTLGD